MHFSCPLRLCYTAILLCLKKKKKLQFLIPLLLKTFQMSNEWHYCESSCPELWGRRHSKNRLPLILKTHFISLFTPLLERCKCWGKSILPRPGYGLGTYRTVDIFNFSHFWWAILEKRRILCFYIIKSIARKGYFGPKYPQIWLQRV